MGVGATAGVVGGGALVATFAGLGGQHAATSSNNGSERIARTLAHVLHALDAFVGAVLGSLRPRGNGSIGTRDGTRPSRDRRLVAGSAAPLRRRPRTRVRLQLRGGRV